MKLNKMNKYFGEEFYNECQDNIDNIWNYLYETSELNYIDNLDDDDFKKVVDIRPIKSINNKIIGERILITLLDRSMLFVTKTKDLFKVSKEYVDDNNIRLEEVYTVRKTNGKITDARELKSGTDKVIISFVKEKINKVSFNSNLSISAPKDIDSKIDKLKKELEVINANNFLMIKVLKNIINNPQIINDSKDEIVYIAQEVYNQLESIHLSNNDIDILLKKIKDNGKIVDMSNDELLLILSKIEEKLELINMDNDEMDLILEEIKGNPELINMHKLDINADFKTTIDHESRLKREYGSWNIKNIASRLSALIIAKNANNEWHERINDKLNDEYVATNFDQNEEDAMEFLKKFYYDHSNLIKCCTTKPIVRGKYISHK